VKKNATAENAEKRGDAIVVSASLCELGGSLLFLEQSLAL
jgi:hypothetical protein